MLLEGKIFGFAGVFSRRTGPDWQRDFAVSEADRREVTSQMKTHFTPGVIIYSRYLRTSRGFCHEMDPVFLAWMLGWESSAAFCLVAVISIGNIAVRGTFFSCSAAIAMTHGNKSYQHISLYLGFLFHLKKKLEKRKQTPNFPTCRDKSAAQCMEN